MSRRSFLGWVFDLGVGGVVGAIVGGIVALNVAIFSGVDRGYEAGVLEVLDHDVVAGLLMILAAVSGPIVGVTFLRRRRRAREKTGTRVAGRR
ncbi:MAG: hypothetical protein WAL25_04610 [Acidimicrobiia bacterium]